MIHATLLLFQEESCESVLLVVVSNAFNSLDCQVALLSVKDLCLSLVKVLANTYRGHAELFVNGQTVYSCEGNTQGIRCR